MNFARERLALLLAILLVASPGPAGAAGRLGAEMFKFYGGTWRPDCKSASSGAVIIAETSVAYMKGDKRISADILPLDEWASYFGETPPEGFQLAIPAADAKGHGLDLVIYQDDKGFYLELAGHPDVEAAIGKAATALKYRHCNEAARPAPAPAASTPATTVAPAPASAEMPDANIMLRDPAFRAAYLKALGKYAKIEWLARMEGLSGTTMKLTVAGREYTQVSCCKEHDCAASNTTVLYSPEKKVVYGKVSLEGKSALIGSPPPEIAKAIGERWRWQWVHDP